MTDADAPDRGDLVSVFMKEQAGREQAGRRPFLILTPAIYNTRSSTVIGCPITSNTAPYAFKVILPEGLAVSGGVLVDQVRALDPVSRRIRRLGAAAPSTLDAVVGLLSTLLRLRP